MKPSRYDLLYNPRFTVTDFSLITNRWNEDSQRARAELDCYLDVPYGGGTSETMDIFRAQGKSKGLVIFIHGGYWRAQDKAGYSFLAHSLTRAGITLAVPNYALCPAVQVRDIVMQIVQACAWCYRNGSNFGAPVGRVFLCGHSAGGHLTAMMLACHWPVYAADLPKNLIKGGLSISGVFDLREIVKAPSINCDVRLSKRESMVVSPAFLPPATDAPLILAVGDAETGGFLRQHLLMSKRWASVIVDDISCLGDNHFTILDSLTQPDSSLFQTMMKMTTA